MKAFNAKNEMKVRWYNSTRTGVILSNKSRQGDEVVIVEWDDNFSVSAENINDLIEVL